MKSAQEIRERISEIEANYSHVLRLPSAEVFSNAPRALMQVSATAELAGLYFALGEKRPRYKCDGGEYDDEEEVRD